MYHDALCDTNMCDILRKATYRSQCKPFYGLAGASRHLVQQGGLAHRWEADKSDSSIASLGHLIHIFEVLMPYTSFQRSKIA